MKKIIILILILVSASVFAHNGEKRGTIVVNLVNFKNNEGRVQVALFDEKSKESYPMEPDNALDSAKAKIKNKKSRVVFDNLKYGSYTVSVHHDQDMDGEMGTNFLGIPNEGYGASRDAKGFMGPPSFEDAKVILNEDTLEININLKY